MVRSAARTADRLKVAGRWTVSIRRLDARRVGPVAVAVVVAVTATLVSSLAQFTSLTPTPPSSLSAAQLNPYIPDSVTAARQSATTCLVTWTLSTTASPPASLTYDVTDGTGTVVATGVSGTSATITVPATPVTPTVRARAGGWTSSLERESATACAGEPFAPTGVTATPGEMSAAVSWTPAGGPTASSYTVTATPASGPTATCPATAPATTCTLSGLVNGVRYTVTATATNTSGSSAASAPTTVTAYPAVMAGTDSVLWLDAADPATLFSDPGCTTQAMTGDTIGCWEDRSATGATATRVNAAQRPQLRGNQINALPALRFTFDYLTGPDVFGGATRDMQTFLVSRENVASDSALLEFNSNDSERVLVHAPLGSTREWYWDAGTCCSTALDRSISPAGVTGLGATTIFAGWKDDTTDTNGFRLNSGGAYSSGSNTTATTTTGFRFGDDVVDHDIAELVTFDRRLSPAEERAVESYLSRKWGRSITPDAPTGVTSAVTGTTAMVAWSPPAWNGGAAVTGYTASAVPTSGGTTRTCTSTAPATSCTLTGLVEGVEYALSVSAANTHGPGPRSAAIPLLTSAPYEGDLALWLDAAAPSTLFTDAAGTTPAATGQEVHRWADRSGNNRHATKPAAATTGATLTTGALNGRTAMRFTRTAPEFYEVTGAGIGTVGSNDRTMLVVGTARTVSGTPTEDWGAFAVWPGYHSGIVARGPQTPGADVTSIEGTSWDNEYDEVTAAAPTVAGAPRLMALQSRSGGAQVTSELVVDGRAAVTADSAAPPPSLLTYPDLLRVGAGVDGDSGIYNWYLDGDIAEVLVYDRALTPTEQRTAESYLAAKWGLTLAPDAPTAVSATGGVNEVAVTWTAPAETGAATVTSYTAIATPTGATCTATPPSTGCTITGLPNGTTYTMTVTATNSAGTGRASAPSAPVSTVPYATAPTGVTALTSGTRMEVAWTAPGDTGGTPITDYAVEYRALGDSTWTPFADSVSTDTVAVVTGLAGGTTYEARVAAVTVTGTGAWSTPSQSEPGQAWRPRHLPGGTAAWFDAQDSTTLSTTGSAIDTWRDKSGNARHAATTGSFRPTLAANSLNGRPGAQFGGDNDHMPFDGSAVVNTDYTVAAVVARTSNEVFNCWLGGMSSGSADENLHTCWRDDTTLTHDQFLTGYDMTVPGYSTVTPTTVINRHSSATGQSTHMDGALLGSSAYTTPLAGWADAALARFNNEYFAGRIGEVVITTAAVGTIDRQRLEGYLRSRWLTPLPAVHPYTVFAPLAPIGPAEPPTGASALTSGTRMDVAWNAPSDTGGTPISDYIVQYRVQGATPWTTAGDAVSTDTITVLTGLVAGTTYETRVAAITSTGTGTWSATVASVPGRVWAPGNLAGGTALWLDADDPSTFTISAGQVDAWRDKSGSGRHATQTGAARPVLTANTMNARPTVVFDGADDHVDFDGSFIVGSDYTVAAAVVRTTNVVPNYFLGGDDGTMNNMLHVGWETDTTIRHGQWDNDYDVTVPPYNPSTSTLLVSTHAAARGKSTHLGGALAGSSPDTQPLTGWAGAAIGGIPSFAPFEGQVGEIVITTSAVGGNDRQRLEGYLAAKWGTPLVGHPYTGHAPLFPAGPAAAPTALTALADQGQADVAWTAPADTGGTPISDYTVQYRAVGAPAWTSAADGTSTAARATVTGLVDGTSYEVRVAAVTAVGEGGYSASAAAVPGRAWSPADLPGLGLWFDADDASTFSLTNGNVDQWRDRSGNNRHASQVSPSRPPRVEGLINGRAGIEFTGSNDFLPFDGSFLVGADYTVAVTGARTSAKPENYYLGGTSNVLGSNLHLGWRSGASLTHAQFDDDYDAAVPAYATPTPTVIINRRGAAGRETYADGSSLSSSAATTGLTGWPGAAVGRYSTTYFEGHVGEVVISTSDLAAVDRQLLEGYLAHKWGTSLPGGHPHAGASPVLLFAEPPTGVSALTDSTTMQVSWAAPTNTGGTPVTDYRVQYRVLGAPGWTTVADPVSTDTTSMITGLSGGTTYQTRVAAITANGVGAWSTHTQSSPGTAWTPAALPGGTAVWFDADDASTFTTTGGAVDQWRDKSGNNRHAAQTGAARPALTPGLINGRPGVQLDGTDDSLPINGSFIANTDYTVAAAVARTAGTSENYYLGGGNPGGSNGSLHLGWRTDTLLTHAQWGNDYDMTVPAYGSPAPTVIVNRHSSTAGKATHADGLQLGTGSADTQPMTGWVDPAIGRKENLFFVGRVGEIVITTTALATADRQRLEGYLAAKWGTPLPAGHPFATARPLSP